MATGTKEALPTLTGQKFKTRKRDEKVKYDAAAFCDQVITGLNATIGTIEEITRFLDQSGSTMDYRYTLPYSQSFICKWAKTRRSGH